MSSGLTVTRREQLKALFDRVIDTVASRYEQEARKAMEGHHTYIKIQEARRIIDKTQKHIEEAVDVTMDTLREDLAFLGFRPGKDKDNAVMGDAILGDAFACNVSFGGYDDNDHILEMRVIKGVLKYGYLQKHWRDGKEDFTIDALVEMPVFPTDVQQQVDSLNDRFTIAMAESELVSVIAEAGVTLLPKGKPDAQRKGNEGQDGSRPARTKARKEKRAVGA